MPIPFAAIGAGVGVARSLFGRKNRYREPNIGPFSYTPDESDPELLLLRRRALEENQRSRGRDINEIARAGLLGSSAAFGILGEGERRGARTLEDVDASTFARRRAEALDLYNRENEFKRQVALSELGGDISYGNQSSLMGLSELGGLGESVGALQGLTDQDIQDYIDYILSKRTRGRGTALTSRMPTGSRLDQPDRYSY